MTDAPQLEPVPEDWGRALAIVAHPDDLEYGAASAIAKWTSSGKEIAYLIATRGEAGIDSMEPEETARIRKQEQIKSASVVGVSSVEFLDHEDGIVEYGPHLRKDLATAIRRHKPEAIITGNFRLTWGRDALNMADHRAVGLAALDAARDAGNRWIFPDLTEQGLEPWNRVHHVFVADSPDSGHGVDVTDHIERGVESLRRHKVYIENLGRDFDPAAFLKDIASWSGAEMGVKYAVKFEVFRI